MNTLNARQWPERHRLLNSGIAVQDYEYRYSAEANLTSLIDHGDGADSVSMSYDGLHRLSSASGLWGSFGYSYDPLNNLRSRSGSQSLSYSYLSGSNRLSSISGSQSRSYSYVMT